jgi:hypothetical protein
LVLLPDTDQHIQPFLLCLFQRYGLTFAQASLDCNPPIFNTPPSLRWQACPTIASFFPFRWESLKLFCPDWPQITILLISISQVA